MFGRFSAILACGLALAIGVWLGLHGNGEPPHLTFFSVGQGDCALLQIHDVNILIDAGPANEYSDAGKTILYPKLRELGIDTIDLVLLSHPDEDHIGGLVSLSKRIRVRKVGVLSHFKSSDKLADCFTKAKIAEQDVLWIDQPSQVEIEDWKLRIGAPPYSSGDSDNDGSMFVWAGNDACSAVFSGDADMLTEATMIPKGDWRAQVMKAGHHGSKFSTGPEWLAAVQPSYIIFSCGRTNRYGHPSPEAVSRAQKSGAKIFRTDLDGTITFAAKRNGFEPIQK